MLLRDGTGAARLSSALTPLLDQSRHADRVGKVYVARFASKFGISSHTMPY
jgi:hypothetical protein